MTKLETLELRFNDGVAWVEFSALAYNTQVLRDVNTALDSILANEEAKCVVFICSSPRVFSTGLDFESLVTGIHDTTVFIAEFSGMLGRILGFPLPTICAINGHCVAGGVMFAMASDYRIALKGRFTFEMREIHMGMGMPRYMLATVIAKLGPKALRDVALFGTSLPQDKCLEFGVFDELVEGKEQFLEAVTKKAKELSVIGDKRDAIKAIKTALYRDLIKDTTITFETYSNITIRNLIPKM